MADANKSPQDEIQHWVDELTRALEIEETVVDIDELLKLAGRAAHTVVRPAAPVTTFIIGYVTGLAEASGQADYKKAFTAATALATELLKQRPQAED